MPHPRGNDNQPDEQNPVHSGPLRLKGLLEPLDNVGENVHKVNFQLAKERNLRTSPEILPIPFLAS